MGLHGHSWETVQKCNWQTWVIYTSTVFYETFSLLQAVPRFYPRLQGSFANQIGWVQGVTWMSVGRLLLVPEIFSLDSAGPFNWSFSDVDSIILLLLMKQKIKFFSAEAILQGPEKLAGRTYNTWDYKYPALWQCTWLGNNSYWHLPYLQEMTGFRLRRRTRAVDRQGNRNMLHCMSVQLWGALIISTCKRWSQKSTKNYFMQLMVNLMHKGCSLEDISSSQPFLCQCLTDQCILKLLVPPSLLCYCQLNTCSGCCNIPFSHLTHTWSSPLLSSAFLSCQELQQLEQPLEKKYLQQNPTHIPPFGRQISYLLKDFSNYFKDLL